MEDSLLKRRAGLKGPAELGELLGIQGPRRQFLKRTKPDAVCLTEGPIHCPGFGHTHLGVVENQGRDIAGMGIAVADKATALGGLIHGRLKNPKVPVGATQGKHWLSLNGNTMSRIGDVYEIVVRHIFSRLAASRAL
jgi:hypothetical protein